tara:strand:+ start:6425 stop:7747 length:1323 start_codon:yes stop_codon:yes gene_type:complete
MTLSDMKTYMVENNYKIAVIGLGYVGLPLAVEFGTKYDCVGFDISSERINQLNDGFDTTLELNEKKIKEARYLKYSKNKEDLKSCNVFIITVPTPIDSVNRPNLKPLLAASKTVGESISKGSIIIYESTVFPGCTEDKCVPVLEKYSGMSFNKDFFCGYSPERINPADKVNTLTKITKITSGSNERTAEVVDNLYNSIIEAGTYKASSIKVAEAAKVIENTQRDLNIALVNELSVIFNLIDIDTIEVLEAAGSKWNFLPFKPGIVGGHCIGVDPYYLTHKAEELGYHPQVILAGRRINDDMSHYAANNIIRLIHKNKISNLNCTIGIMGITFKENCPDIRNSKVVDIVNKLKEFDYNVVVDDPWADFTEVKNTYDIELQNINESNKVDVLVVAVGHNQYRDLSAKDLRGFIKNDKPIIADLKSIYSLDELKNAGFEIFRL